MFFIWLVGFGSSVIDDSGLGLDVLVAAMVIRYQKPVICLVGCSVDTFLLNILSKMIRSESFCEKHFHNARW